MRVAIFLLVLTTLNACKETTKKNTDVVTVNRSTKKEVVSVSDYEDLEGNPIALSDYKGKRVLLNFWATWCRPCIEEMPSLLRAQEILGKENYIFLLATDQSVKTIVSFKTRKDFDFNFIRFTGSFSELGIRALPKTFLYDDEGNKVDEISGAIEWDSPEILNKLRSIK